MAADFPFVDLSDVSGVDLAAGPPPPIAVPVAGAVRAAVASGPRIIVDGDPIAEMRARILRLPNLDPIASVTSARGDEGREQRNAPGSGSLTLMLDDPIAALVRKYDLVQQIIEGQVAFTTIVEDFTTTDLSTEEEAGELTVLSGRGHLALLEWGLVYPSRGPGALPIQRDRIWNWAEQVYDDSSWPASTNVGPATGATRVPALQAGPPAVAPSIPGATWRGSVGDTQAFAPGGPVYYRGTITVPTTGEYVILWGADNYGELYVGGQQVDSFPRILNPTAYLEGHAVSIRLTAGDIVFAARVVNIGPATPTPGHDNPVGLYLALVTVDEDGNVDTVIELADGTWKALGRPGTEPGMTPGEVARHSLGEWQQRAADVGQDIPVITLTCTDDVDTLGQPWIETPNIATKVGNDLLTFFTEISATYWEMRMRPASLELDLYAKGTVPPSGVVYAPASPGPPGGDPTVGNMRSIQRKEL